MTRSISFAFWPAVRSLLSSGGEDQGLWGLSRQLGRIRFATAGLELRQIPPHLRHLPQLGQSFY